MLPAQALLLSRREAAEQLLGDSLSVLYRAIWHEDVAGDRGPAETIDKARVLFSSWASAGALGDPLPDGMSQVSLGQGRSRLVTLRTVSDPGDDSDGQPGGGFEAVARDESTGDAGTTWLTRLRVVAAADGVDVLVETEMESDDPTVRVSVGRPRMVSDLLTGAANPCLGGSAVVMGVVNVGAEAVPVLLDILRSDTRTLPVVVCSEPGGAHDGSWRTWADRIAARVEGVATVIVLDNEAVTAFKEQLGSLAVWGGGIRIYNPSAVEDFADGWRHRFITRARLTDAPDPSINRIVYSVLQLSTRRKIPNVLSAPFASPDAVDLQEEADATGLDEAERAQLEAALDVEIAERSELERELAVTNGHLGRLRDKLIEAGMGDLFWGVQHEAVAEIPDDVQDTSEAIFAAQAYLTDWVVLPDSAVREVDNLDTAPAAYAWGNATWRGLRSLAAYAEQRANGFDGGGFRDWCMLGAPFAWPATTKKLAMRESQTVEDSPKYWKPRTFKVSTDVRPGGEVVMWAHLKISEGGGDLAPRVYFHDDTGGETKKVHVGFVGPHYLVPNTKG